MALSQEQLDALETERQALLDMVRTSRERIAIIEEIQAGAERYRDEYLTELDGKLSDNQAEIEKRISGKRIVNVPRDAEVIENPVLPVDGGRA